MGLTDNVTSSTQVFSLFYKAEVVSHNTHYRLMTESGMLFVICDQCQLVVINVNQKLGPVSLKICIVKIITDFFSKKKKNFFISRKVEKKQRKNKKTAVSLFVFVQHKQGKEQSIYSPVRALNDSPNN